MFATHDPVRARFFDMRGLAGDNPYTWNDAYLFYRQAKFMKDFTDDYTEAPTFSMRYPCFQRMGYERLRAYFTWRTAALRGEIKPICASYFFLYIYEIIACIHHAPAAAPAEMLRVWRAFPASPLDEYLPAWLRDFFVYYPQENDAFAAFSAFARENGLRGLLREHFLWEENADDLLELWCDFAGLETAKLGANLSLLRKCLPAAIAAAPREYFMLVDTRARRWFPFRRAVFHPHLRRADTQIHWPTGETFTCMRGEWQQNDATPIARRGKTAQRILRLADATLCALTGTKSRAPAGSQPYDAAITAAITAAYHEATRIVVSVRTENLSRIREEANTTTEKLVVDEAINEPNQAPTPPQIAPPAQPPAMQFSQQERAFLQAILTGGDMSAFALPEILADSINEKAHDHIGDALLDDEFNIYPEYLHIISPAGNLT
jgi:hypothetical protein